jgi:hypothetical protein
MGVGRESEAHPAFGNWVSLIYTDCQESFPIIF